MVVAFEIDEGTGDDPYEARRLLRQVAIEHGDTENLPSLKCDDHNEWQSMVDWLEDLWLWDRDYKLTGGLDRPPEEERRVKERLGIGKDYFTTPVPDLGNVDFEEYERELIDRLRKIVDQAGAGNRT